MAEHNHDGTVFPALHKSGEGFTHMSQAGPERTLKSTRRPQQSTLSLLNARMGGMDARLDNLRKAVGSLKESMAPLLSKAEFESAIEEWEYGIATANFKTHTELQNLRKLLIGSMDLQMDEWGMVSAQVLERLQNNLLRRFDKVERCLRESPSLPDPGDDSYDILEERVFEVEEQLRAERAEHKEALKRIEDLIVTTESARQASVQSMMDRLTYSDSLLKDIVQTVPARNNWPPQTRLSPPSSFVPPQTGISYDTAYGLHSQAQAREPRPLPPVPVQASQANAVFANYSRPFTSRYVIYSPGTRLPPATRSVSEGVRSLATDPRAYASVKSNPAVPESVPNSSTPGSSVPAIAVSKPAGVVPAAPAPTPQAHEAPSASPASPQPTTMPGKTIPLPVTPVHKPTSMEPLGWPHAPHTYTRKVMPADASLFKPMPPWLPAASELQSQAEEAEDKAEDKADEVMKDGAAGGKTDKSPGNDTSETKTPAQIISPVPAYTHNLETLRDRQHKEPVSSVFAFDHDEFTRKYKDQLMATMPESVKLEPSNFLVYTPKFHQPKGLSESTRQIPRKPAPAYIPEGWTDVSRDMIENQEDFALDDVEMGDEEDAVEEDMSETATLASADSDEGFVAVHNEEVALSEPMLGSELVEDHIGAYDRPVAATQGDEHSESWDFSSECSDAGDEMLSWNPPQAAHRYLIGLLSTLRLSIKIIISDAAPEGAESDPARVESLETILAWISTLMRMTVSDSEWGYYTTRLMMDMTKHSTRWPEDREQLDLERTIGEIKEYTRRVVGSDEKPIADKTHEGAENGKIQFVNVVDKYGVSDG
ncbi:hypothetical protein L202_02020 [Cryptococcus amylolentus CBS 6039]|uniref:Uncharacterized protein n=2 Tax=Cryptococcus amylolentus TaxID=104669 RepID=A0A1E3HZ32_9TREE|nr:hypothetical protein L202_02020 [Cryptococcus amylolentus CBS 6039]ODN81613.1 hypothetical protein L202_02020 [Cryptococcus amylolentus CBS 6039]ODO10169.1 hypothetical protein I350_02398 [Cryptococcus amylolentus CBS 6273]